MAMQCPLCRSHQVIRLDRAKRIGGLAGAAGGGLSGWAAATTGTAVSTEIISAIGLVAFPAVSTIGIAGKALISALLGAATAGVTGAKLGEVIDQKVLHNYVCQSCGLQFGDVHCDHSFE